MHPLDFMGICTTITHVQCTRSLAMIVISTIIITVPHYLWH